MTSPYKQPHIKLNAAQSHQQDQIIKAITSKCRPTYCTYFHNHRLGTCKVTFTYTIIDNKTTQLIQNFLTQAYT
jgi:hypothetical protein